MSDVLRVRGRRKEIRDALRQFAQAVAGRSEEARGPMQQVMTRVGMVALSRIKDAFVVKARGGTDESGLQWPPLKSSTIAYSRRHPGVPPSKKRAPFRPSWMLTEKQRKRWWQLNALGGAAFAWRVLKSEGAKTLIGEYGNTPVEILRDTGLLLNSLTPGLGSPEQVFDAEATSVVVGTNRKWAGCHHRGIPGRLPQRRLWPEPSQWPESWWADILGEAKIGLLEVAMFLIRRAAR
ncbi:MAG: hypothetical protein K2X38_25465 [Gemmataceae bacterium]|nr:hypothetical protein [Gemmataceae bacterium]